VNLTDFCDSFTAPSPANVVSGSTKSTTFFDGDRDVGRIYLVHSDDGTETWFWGVSFRVTKCKSYGYAISLDEATAGFRAEYLARQNNAERPKAQ
jgi:hypothetical protein